jgi:hypothetical protein
MMLKYEIPEDAYLGVSFGDDPNNNIVFEDHILTLKKGKVLSNSVFDIKNYSKEFCAEMKQLERKGRDEIIKVYDIKLQNKHISYYCTQNPFKSFNLNSIVYPYSQINLAILKELVYNSDRSAKINIKKTISAIRSTNNIEKQASLKALLEKLNDQITTTVNEAVTQIGILCKDIPIDPGICLPIT